MTGAGVCANALKYKGFVYWYGGKGQKCTSALLNSLAKTYPSVYTLIYRNKCKQDIAAGKSCIDCSGLVCRAYGIGDLSTYQMAKDGRFKKYTGTPLNGMIVWKPSHVGIYYNGKVIEARGIDWDVTTSRTYRKSDWTCVYTVEGVEYMAANKTTSKKTAKTAVSYLQAAMDVINGKAGNGAERVNYLKSAGYDADIVQEIVNLAIKGAAK